MNWSPRPGSNRRPYPYQGYALPTELRGPVAASSRPQMVEGGGFEPPKAYANRFTVCSLWPLGNPSIFRTCAVKPDCRAACRPRACFAQDTRVNRPTTQHPVLARCPGHSRPRTKVNYHIRRAAVNPAGPRRRRGDGCAARFRSGPPTPSQTAESAAGGRIRQKARLTGRRVPASRASRASDSRLPRQTRA
jgi:hypothetical protein